MIKFPFSLFSESEGFPIHLQYGKHEEDDCYPHGHEDFSELVVVLEGSAQHIVNNESYGISKGDVFVINQYTEHSFENAVNLIICNFMFRPETVFANIYDMKKLPGFQALFVLEPHYSSNYRFCSQLKLTSAEFITIRSRIEEMMDCYTAKETGWQDTLFSSFTLFCITLSKLYRTDKASSDNEYLKLANAVAYIENNYCGNITSDELAKMSGYSERQFLRLFKSVFSATPSAYIVNLRMKKAQLLLRTGNTSIGEIAWSCGYDDHNYFSRVFRNHFGISPSAYRDST